MDGDRAVRRCERLAVVAVVRLHRQHARDVRLATPVRRLSDGEPLRPSQRVSVLAAHRRAAATADLARAPRMGRPAYPRPRTAGPTGTARADLLPVRVRHRHRERDDARGRDRVPRLPGEPLGGARLPRPCHADAPPAHGPAGVVAALEAAPDARPIPHLRSGAGRPRPRLGLHRRMARATADPEPDRDPRQQRQPQPLAMAGLGMVADRHRPGARGDMEGPAGSGLAGVLAVPVPAILRDAGARARLAR